jgi:tRNA modification GTPase
LRHSDDPVERLGIERSHESHAHADIVVQVIEVGRELSAEEAENLRDLRAQRALIVLNKVDLQASLGAEAVRAAFVARYGGAAEFPASVAVSAATGEGIAALRRALVEHARVRRLSLQNDAVVAVNARHREVLLRALAALQQCECDLAAHEPPEILAAELRRAVITLGEVAGENVSEEVLDRVFARFCIGK